MSMNKKRDRNELVGTVSAFAAYGMWGIFPLYWKLLHGVEPLQTLSHRVVWASVFCVLLLAGLGRLGELRVLFGNRSKLRLVLLASLFATSNWGIYIWAVNVGRVTESALGYYINPLLSVIFGLAFFGEKVDRWTWTAVAVAGVGLVAAAAAYGSVPWVSLLIALTFAFYGVVKKKLGLDPLTGLTVETMAAAPLALAYLVARQVQGVGAFGVQGWGITALLCLAGAVTAIPLLLFAKAANTISLQRMGFIQYLSPTGQLLLGLFAFGEKPSPALLVAFAGVIAAVLIYISTRGLRRR